MMTQNEIQKTGANIPMGELIKIVDSKLDLLNIHNFYKFVTFFSYLNLCTQKIF